MTRRVYVDWEGLALALEAACADRGLSFRAAATEMGLAPSGLTRLRQGHALSADAYVTLLAWLDPAGPWHYSWMGEVTLNGA